MYKIDDPDSCKTILSVRHNIRGSEPIGDERCEGSEEETSQMSKFPDLNSSYVSSHDVSRQTSHFMKGIKSTFLFVKNKDIL